MLGHCAISELPISTSGDFVVPPEPPVVEESKGAIVYPNIQYPTKKKVRKAVKQALIEKSTAAPPTAEEIAALTEALLKNIPVAEAIDFNELRELIAIEQERIRQEQMRAEEEEYILTLLLAHHHRRRFTRSNG